MENKSYKTTNKELVNLFDSNGNQLTIEEVINLLPDVFNLPDKTTRFEVIDSSGRAYVHKSKEVKEFQFQDDGKTLKVFLI